MSKMVAGAIPMVQIFLKFGSITFSGPVAWLITGVVAVVILGVATYFLMRECKKLHHKME